jgi:hypothetical protein
VTLAVADLRRLGLSDPELAEATVTRTIAAVQARVAMLLAG